jgi:Flp pilus assembly protein TadG
MSGLMRRLRSRGAERGAVAVLVAILFGSGVLLGMAALVVDVGGMYAEKAQLQNGADAGALAVATGCAKGSATCGTSVTAVNAACSTAANASTGIASCNANDNKTAVDQVCGVGSGLLGCTGPQNGCPTAPAGNYAQVQTSTLTSGGSTLLPPAFGKAVMGSSWSGKNVQACAQASWGPPATLGNAVAFSISDCEWNTDTGSGASFASQPPYPPWPQSYLRAGNVNAARSENVLVLHGESTATSCGGSDTAGWDKPGAFGWVGDGSSCSVSITNNTYPANTGNNAINACVSTFQSAYTNHSPIFIPVYSGTSGTGAGVQYTLKGFAAFILTGWDFTSGNAGWNSAGGTVKAPSLIALSEGNNTNQSNYCHKPIVASNSDVCVYGFFTQALIPASALPGGSGGQNLGATSVKLAG